VAELHAALEATLNSLKARRPNLPAIRQDGTISPFDGIR